VSVPKVEFERAIDVRFARDELARMRSVTAGASSLRLLEFAIREKFPKRTAVISSFAAESVVLLHQVSLVDPETPVLFLNTGKLFGETLRYRDRLQEFLGLTDIRCIGPNPADRDRLDSAGTLWSRDPDACCHFRKVIPLDKATDGFAAIVTGRKRFQTERRAAMEPIELFAGRFRFNPLAGWSWAELQNYILEHKLPPHPLAEDGFSSIGCIPCTRRINPGENYRDGRWAGFGKQECGIHAGVDGEGI
jgi:phosphoadenosine phosphosulfate reductase